MRLRTLAAFLFMIHTAVVTSMLAIAGKAYADTREAHQHADLLYAWRYQYGSINTDVIRLSGAAIRFNNGMLARDAGDIQATRTQAAAIIGDMSRRLVMVQALPLEPEEVDQRVAFTRSTETYIQEIQVFLQATAARPDEMAVRLAVGHQEDWNNATSATEPFLNRELGVDVAIEESNSNTLTWALIGGGAASISSLVLLVVVFFRSMLRPVVELAGIAARISRGEEVAIRRTRRSNEIGDLTRAMESWQTTVQHRLAISEATVALNDRVDPAELVQSAAGILLDLTHAHRVTLAVMKDGRLTPVSSAPGPLGADSMSLPPDTPLGAAMARMEPVIGDLTDTEWYRMWLRYPTVADCGPLLALPLISGGELMGAAVAFRRAGDTPFTSLDADYVRVVSTPLAAAIRVAGLFDQLLRANNELGRANASKTEFLGGLGAELRAPIESVAEHADRLADVLRAVDESLPDEVRQEIAAAHVDRVRVGLRRLQGMLDNVLDIAAVETGRATAGEVDLDALLGDVVWNHIADADERSVSLLPYEGRLGTFTTDAAKLRRILDNLVGNAVKFTSAGGTVSVDGEVKGNLLRLRVRDTGAGIEAERQREILSSEKGGAGGEKATGGLALARRFCELLGGRIRVDSKVGVGSSFTIELPQLAPAGAAKAAAATAA